MAKYRVGLSKTVVYTGTIIVEIPDDDADAAETVANEVVETLNSSLEIEEDVLKASAAVVDKDPEWYEDSTTYEIEDIEDDD